MLVFVLRCPFALVAFERVLRFIVLRMSVLHLRVLRLRDAIPLGQARGHGRAGLNDADGSHGRLNGFDPGLVLVAPNDQVHPVGGSCWKNVFVNYILSPILCRYYCRYY